MVLILSSVVKRSARFALMVATAHKGGAATNGQPQQNELERGRQNPSAKPLPLLGSASRPVGHWSCEVLEKYDSAN